MQFLPIVPALIAAYVAFRHSAPRAFLNVYIPVLLLLPMYYRWVIPLLPDPTFEQATILPIAAAFLWREATRWKFSWTDLLVASFAGCIACSEYLNAGYDEAQNLAFDMFASFLLPYILTKGMIEPGRLSALFARRIVLMFLAVSVISVYEFRMGVTPWMFLRRFFPFQGLEWVTTFRYGFARIGGPYGHAILAGLLLAVGFRLQRWLEWGGYWEPVFRGRTWFRIGKSRLVTIGLLAGIVMTMVRGPWLGGLVGAALPAVGRTRNRLRTFWALVLAVVVLGIPAATSFYAYASVGRAHAKTASQETAAYRMELLDKYVDTALKHAAWGYGRNTWPHDPGAPSIDNYYLLLCLMHGVIVTGLLVAILLSMTFRLVWYELRSPARGPKGSSLGLTLAGIIVLYAFTIATVYMGLQTIPVFAIIIGWSEGYLIARRKETLSARAMPLFAFRRVLA